MSDKIRKVILWFQDSLSPLTAFLLVLRTTCTAFVCISRKQISFGKQLTWYFSSNKTKNTDFLMKLGVLKQNPPNFQICAFCYCISIRFHFISLKNISSMMKKITWYSFHRGTVIFVVSRNVEKWQRGRIFWNFRLPSWRSGILGMVQKKSKIPPIRLSFCSFILANSYMRKDIISCSGKGSAFSLTEMVLFSFSLFSVYFGPAHWRLP